MRTLREIALEIKAVWKKPYFGAVPYLEAMVELETIEDNYFYDSGRSIVLYFLGNTQTWRGEDARRIKKELKAML
jgi:hypothetical protein